MRNLSAAFGCFLTCLLSPLLGVAQQTPATAAPTLPALGLMVRVIAPEAPGARTSGWNVLVP